MKPIIALLLLLFSNFANASGISCEQWAGYAYYLGQFAEVGMTRDDMIHNVIQLNADKVASEDMTRVLLLVSLIYDRPGGAEKRAENVYAACQRHTLDELLGRNV